jgi:hypothetical protein
MSRPGGKKKALDTGTIQRPFLGKENGTLLPHYEEFLFLIRHI